jgi:hypothetical protein
MVKRCGLSTLTPRHQTAHEGGRRLASCELQHKLIERDCLLASHVAQAAACSLTKQRTCCVGSWIPGRTRLEMTMQLGDSSAGCML